MDITESGVVDTVGLEPREVISAVRSVAITTVTIITCGVRK
jgi:hypothetical protein